ncbi:DUF2231 domain-containing protein [Amycolatopsis nigrescens]|uniref:DUF2231 domain-containing protein n=1 Tax=Amycolatopsis nigrescens TaxID=381445 RepID=UPI00146D0FA7|nr:DUF2231 domain-containing protein [Amycolatopsis nigrescens]
MDEPGEAGTRTRRRKVPLHPTLVTVPIGCWVMSPVLDIVGMAKNSPGEFTTASTWLLGIGLLTAVLAGVVGLADALPIPPRTAAYRQAMIHLSLALVAVLLYGVNYLMRTATPGGPVPVGLLVFSLINLVVLLTTARVGAALAYRHR